MAKGLAYQPDPLFGLEVQQRFEELSDALAGRVEGISASLAMRDVSGLETLANGLDALGSGLQKLQKQNSAQFREFRKTQAGLLKESLDKPSLMTAIRLPYNLARANVALTRNNSRSNYGATKEMATNVIAALRSKS